MLNSLHGNWWFAEYQDRKQLVFIKKRDNHKIYTK